MGCTLNCSCIAKWVVYISWFVITVIIGRITRLNSESRYPKDDLAKLMFKLVQWFLKRFLKKVTNNTDRQQIYLLLELRLRLFYFIFYFCYALTNIVLTGNGQQQFISIPVSLATGGNQQIQLLTFFNLSLRTTN
jgi:hypothetical protein